MKATTTHAPSWRRTLRDVGPEAPGGHRVYRSVAAFLSVVKCRTLDAACGTRVNRKSLTEAPTCEACRLATVPRSPGVPDTVERVLEQARRRLSLGAIGRMDERG